MKYKCLAITLIFLGIGSVSRMAGAWEKVATLDAPTFSLLDFQNCNYRVVYDPQQPNFGLIYLQNSEATEGFDANGQRIWQEIHFIVTPLSFAGIRHGFSGPNADLYYEKLADPVQRPFQAEIAITTTTPSEPTPSSARFVFHYVDRSDVPANRNTWINATADLIGRNFILEKTCPKAMPGPRKNR